MTTLLSIIHCPSLDFGERKISPPLVLLRYRLLQVHVNGWELLAARRVVKEVNCNWIVGKGGSGWFRPRPPRREVVCGKL